MTHSSLIDNSLAYGWGSMAGLYALVVNLTIDGVIMLLISTLLLPAASKFLIMALNRMRKTINHSLPQIKDTSHFQAIPFMGKNSSFSHVELPKPILAA